MFFFPRLEMAMMKNQLLGESIKSSENNFNCVRLIAALLVVYFHARPVTQGPDPLSQLLMPSANIGQLAVGVFFFLSGLFVMQSWLNNPHVFAFMLKRFARIFPGLAVCVTLTTLIAVAFFSTQGLTGLLDLSTWRYIFNNIFLHFLQKDMVAYSRSLEIPGVYYYLTTRAMNGPLWTLFWEGRFYVTLALLGLAAMTISKYWFTLMGTILLLCMSLDHTFIRDSLWEDQLLSLFVCGMIVQTLSNHITIKPAVLVSIAIYLYLNPLGSGIFGIYLAACAIALWFGTASLPMPKFFRRHDYSYSIYIYHWPIMQMLKKFLPATSHFVFLICTLIILIPISFISWVYIEKPAMNWAKRLSERHFFFRKAY
jgi:peptidoglycan/LPS O-acetylase OafA/YrhL